MKSWMSFPMYWRTIFLLFANIKYLFRGYELVRPDRYKQRLCSAREKAPYRKSLSRQIYFYFQANLQALLTTKASGKEKSFPEARVQVL